MMKNCNKLRSGRSGKTKAPSLTSKIRDLVITDSQLVKLQRLLLKHSSQPQLAYSQELLLEFPNPAVMPDHNEETFAIDYLLHNIYRKLLLPTADKTALDFNAMLAFKKGELSCSRTNRRLQKIDPRDEEVNTFIFRVQRFIANVLGPLDIEKVVENSHFSSGASYDLTSSKCSPQEKYKFENSSCTLMAIQRFAQYLYSEGDATGLKSYRVVTGNRVLTVPKSNKTNRTIAAEPTLNMYFQLGVGSFFKKRLRKFGIDLTNQAINQRLARQGSIDGKLATIDLENASNSLSYKTVELLLPLDWFVILDELRSRYGTLPNGNLHRYRMFSSMGNGFTFELETLIFFAICKVATGGFVSVYGDDIVLESDKAPDAIRWLTFFGFKTNVQKSFISGPFRESCGKHYYKGADVSPFFVREVPRALNVYLLYNNIVRWQSRDDIYDIRLDEAREYVLSLIPEDSRIFGPDGYGDGHLLAGSQPRSLYLKWQNKLQHLSFRSMVPCYPKIAVEHRGSLTMALLGLAKETQVSILPLKRCKWRIIDILVHDS